MKPPPFDYFRPGSLDEALRLLSKNENAKVLAGGQSLMSLLNLRYVFPSALIDINDLHDLAGVDAGPQRVRIGALTRQRTIETDKSLMSVAPIVAEALHLVGHRQTRNRGTLGGSLCHLDPAAELPALALLYEAIIEAVGPTGRRTMTSRDFVKGFMMPAIDADEIVTAIEFAPWGERHGHAFMEFSRRHGDYAIASAACLVESDNDGLITRCSLVVGGLGSVPQHFSSCAVALVGTRAEDTTVASALKSCADLEVVGDFHASGEYRLRVAKVMVRKSIDTAYRRSTVQADAA